MLLRNDSYLRDGRNATVNASMRELKRQYIEEAWKMTFPTQAQLVDVIMNGGQRVIA